jgi:hypothetical protein
LVKPVEVDSLVSTVKERIMHRLSKVLPTAKPLSALLKEHAASIVDQALNAIKADAKASGNFSSTELSKHLNVCVNALAEQLERESEEPHVEALQWAAEHGTSLGQNKGIAMARVTAEFRHLGEALYHALQSHLRTVDLAPTLVSDLTRLNRGLSLLQEQSLEGFLKKSGIPRK